MTHLRGHEIQANRFALSIGGGDGCRHGLLLLWNSRVAARVRMSADILFHPGRAPRSVDFSDRGHAWRRAWEPAWKRSWNMVDGIRRATAAVRVQMAGAAFRDQPKQDRHAG